MVEVYRIKIYKLHLLTILPKVFKGKATKELRDSESI